MSDIRSFFGGKAKGPTGRSELSSLKNSKDQAAPSTPSPPKKRTEKIVSSKKKSPTKVETIDLDLDEDSDGESPIPSSVRKAAMKKRGRAVVSSDSDDEAPVYAPPSAKKRAPAIVTSPSPSPAKKKRSKKALIEESDEEKTESPKKNAGRLTKVSVEEEEQSDVEMISGTDSEDEFVEKKRPKKNGKDLKGQKKLTFAAEPVKNVSDNSKPAAPTLVKMAATDFFGGSKKVEEKKKSKKSPKKNVIEKEKTKKSTDVSPSQKENHVEKPSKTKGAPTESVKTKEIVAEKKSPQKESEVITKRKTPTPSKILKTPVVPIPKSAATSKQTSTSLPPKPKSPLSKNYLPWVNKYKPSTISHLIGQHGDKSPMNKLMAWLKDWAKHNLGEGGKIKKPKPSPFMQSSDGTPFKAVLLSGTPGVGKTTCAHMACNQLGLQFVEMNASDVRNKKSLEAQIGQLTGSHQIDEYFASKGNEASNKHDDTEVHHVLIMDEVDGMSGNEDRAGISVLIDIIKETKIPIICICNDRQHPKMRTLVNYCFDVRFPRPRVEQIRGRIMSIAAQEKVKLSKEELDELIEMSGHDVRQTIYNLQMRSALANNGNLEKKDETYDTFTAARKLLNNNSSLEDKMEMFFVDYSIMPLFVQQNYVNLKNEKHKPREATACLRKAADLISLGDLASNSLRSTGAWKLLQEQGMLGCALPTIATKGWLKSMITFPAWLGKNSNATKRQRMIRQIASHAHLKISADTQAVATDYVPMLRQRLTQPLLEKESEGVAEVVLTMTEYDLLRDDVDAIAELAVWPGKIDPGAKIQSKVKAAVTRTLNKEHRLLPYAIEEISKGKKKKAAAVVSVEMDEDGNLVEKTDEDEGGESDEEGDESGDDSKAKTAKPTPSSGSNVGRGGGTRGGGAKRGTRGRGK